MNFDDLKQALCTVVAVPVTPFAAGGQIDWEGYRGVIQRLTAGGVRAITPNGNTGEFYSLAVEECSAVVTAAARAAGDSLLVAGVGHDAGTAAAMARQAGRAGAKVVMIHQIVHPYRSAAGWLAYHQAIAEAVPELGVVPYIRDLQVTPAMLAGLAQTCPNVIGVKYAVNDPLQFANMVRVVGTQTLAWVCGVAESWAPFFWVGGARGFTSGLVNVNIQPSLDLLARLQAGDYPAAMALWATLKPFEDLRARYANGNNVSVIKEAMAQLGLGSRTVRPPISELPEAERAEVAAILSAWHLAVPAYA
jgi:4-hydroxy-tetrahydrodipicolinate synthase